VPHGPGSSRPGRARGARVRQRAGRRRRGHDAPSLLLARRSPRTGCSRRSPAARCRCPRSPMDVLVRPTRSRAARGVGPRAGVDDRRRRAARRLAGAARGPARGSPRAPGAATTAGIRLDSDAQRIEVDPVDVEADDYRDFAHVVVDEAQDLSPDAVANGRPPGPLRVVDGGRRPRAALTRRRAPHTWEEVAALIGPAGGHGDPLADVNYRTPAEIGRLSRGPCWPPRATTPTTSPEAVRETGVTRTTPRAPSTLAAAAATAAPEPSAREGTVVCHRRGTPDLPELEAHVASSVPDGAPCARPHARPATAKGLEFDDVVIAPPTRSSVPP
jgi:hypothetical protein